MTRGDRDVLFNKQNVKLVFSGGGSAATTIEVDTTQTFQSIDGFGYALTGGSASLLNSLPAATLDPLLKELFLWDSTNIGISYLRISIGASDLSASTFTYDDILDDIKLILSSLKAKGLKKAIVVNLTNSKLNIPVIRVIVPGLETFKINKAVIGQRAKESVKKWLGPNL